jgi:hypothetical protein
MRTVVARLAALLADPAPVISAGRVTTREPALSSDLPWASVDFALNAPAAVGLGRIGREGKQLVRSTAVVTVGNDPHFRAEGQVWRIPEVLAFDPSGRGVEVTAGGTPLTQAAEPQGADQFRLDPVRREIRFGAPQLEGRVLEIGYPTLAFSEDIRFERHTGLLGLTLWAADPVQLDALSDAAFARLTSDRAAAFARGFLRFIPSSLTPGSLQHFEPVAASPFGAWRQRAEFGFTFEAEAGGEALSNGRIRQITTELGGVEEPLLTVPSTA